MYGLKCKNGAVIGTMSMVAALNKMRGRPVVVAIVRLSDGKEVVTKIS